MKKIGIITLFHDNYNWGGVLQGYALKKTIEQLFSERNEEVQVDIVNYKSDFNPVYTNILRQITQYSMSEIVAKLKGRVIKINKRDFEEKIKERKKLFAVFMEKYTTNAEQYNDESLATIAREYNYMISGSDQVWNPNVARLGFFQTMIPSTCVKISYAASIARDELSEYESSIMIPMIEKFDYISVRERTAKNILDKCMKVKKCVIETLDPTMLLTKEQWSQMRNNVGEKQRKYVLCFFFGESMSYRSKIVDFCEKNELETRFIPFAKQHYIASDEKGECERIYDIGPEEFISQISDAEYIFTDSFHGAVFSILFHKSFCVFERSKTSKVSMNSRLYDLLNKFELSDRMISDTKQIDSVITKQIDYHSVDNLLEKYRKESYQFLLNVFDLEGDVNE